MAGPPKKARKPSEGDDEVNTSDSESYNGPQEIQATFEGRNLESHDFDGIKQLLHQVFLKSHVDSSQMSDMLIGQNGIGSVLKQSLNDSDDEDDANLVNNSDVFGITTVLNLTAHKESSCVQQIYSLLEDLLKKHADKDTQTGVDGILRESNKIGLLINERFLNIPATISEMMLNSLKEEITRMKKKKPEYDFDYFLMISKISKPKGKTVFTEEDIIFSNDEERIFVKEADFSFEYTVLNESDTGLSGHWGSEDTQLIPFRLVTLFKANKLQSIITEIEHYLKT